MATLTRNANPVIPACDGEQLTLDRINERISENFALSTITADVNRLQDTISASANPSIRDIKKATTFPIRDILQMMITHEGCKYVRIYNGFNSSGQYVTYLVPLDENTATYEDCQTSSPCCGCNPCPLDRILNP